MYFCSLHCLCLCFLRIYFYDCMFWFLSASLGTFLKYLSVFGTHKHIRTSMCGSGLKTNDFTVRPPDKGFHTFFFLFALSCSLRWISQSLPWEYKSSAGLPSWRSVDKKKCQVDFYLNPLFAVHNSLPSSQCPLEQDLVQSIQ